MVYCQHSVGLGHLARSLALTGALAERFDVTLLSGGALPAGVRVPDGVELVPMPALSMVDRQLITRDVGHSVDEAFTLRRRALLGALHAQRPQALVIEMFPFGRKKFGPELLPLLEAAAALGADRPLIACSLRDILVSRDVKQAEHDEAAVQKANRHFDAILVHADPRLARLEESFRPATPLRVPVHYTGFVVPADDVVPAARRAGIVVSAGGGIVGGPLLRAALEAQRLLWPRTGEPMRLIAGPFLPEEEWRALERDAAGTEGVQLIRSVANLRSELARAAASVSQCGYNTAFDLLRTEVPALVVPYHGPREDEQMRRARRLEELGALCVLDPARLDGATLAAELEALLRFAPRPAALDLDGAHRTAALLEQLVAGRRREAVA
jgi:predicted glycosyltransferase